MNYVAFPGIDYYNTPDSIIDFVCKTMDVTRKEITSKKRYRHIVIARQTATYLICQKLKRATLQEVGNYFNCDHATVIHSKKATENAIDTVLEYRKQIEDMKLILRIP